MLYFSIGYVNIASNKKLFLIFYDNQIKSTKIHDIRFKTSISFNYIEVISNGHRINNDHHDDVVCDDVQSLFLGLVSFAN